MARRTDNLHSSSARNICNDPGKTRTNNPLLRRPMSYPLGHGALKRLLKQHVLKTANRNTNHKRASATVVLIFPRVRLRGFSFSGGKRDGGQEGAVLGFVPYVSKSS